MNFFLRRLHDSFLAYPVELFLLMNMIHWPMFWYVTDTQDNEYAVNTSVLAVRPSAIPQIRDPFWDFIILSFFAVWVSPPPRRKLATPKHNRVWFKQREKKAEGRTGKKEKRHGKWFNFQRKVWARVRPAIFPTHRTVGWNCLKSTHAVYENVSLPWTWERLSEWASKQMSAAVRASEASSVTQANEWAVRMN